MSTDVMQNGKNGADSGTKPRAMQEKNIEGNTDTTVSHIPTSSSTVESRCDGSILSHVGRYCNEILAVEACTLRTLGIDAIPLSELTLRHNKESVTPTTNPLNSLGYKKYDSLEALVREFTSTVTASAKLLHETIEEVPQNRPFGGTTSVDRLLNENLGLMTEIVELSLNEHEGTAKS